MSSPPVRFDRDDVVVVTHVYRNRALRRSDGGNAFMTGSSLHRGSTAASATTPGSRTRSALDSGFEHLLSNQVQDFKQSDGSFNLDIAQAAAATTATRAAAAAPGAGAPADQTTDHPPIVPPPRSPPVIPSPPLSAGAASSASGATPATASYPA